MVGGSVVQGVNGWGSERGRVEGEMRMKDGRGRILGLVRGGGWK